MNIREGMRRVAILAGGVGACAGILVASIYSADVYHRRVEQQTFQKLVATYTFKRELARIKAIAQNKEEDWFKNNAAVPAGYTLDATPKKDIFDAIAALSGATEGWSVNYGGISRMYFDSNGQIESLDTTEGKRVHANVHAGWVEYLMTPLMPILGFLLPWFVVRFLGWVVAGFVQPLPNERAVN